MKRLLSLHLLPVYKTLCDSHLKKLPRKENMRGTGIAAHASMQTAYERGKYLPAFDWLILVFTMKMKLMQVREIVQLALL